METSEQIANFYLKLPATFAVIGKTSSVPRDIDRLTVTFLGSSRSGKTFLVNRILSSLSEVTSDCPPISKFVLVYRHYQKIYDEIIESIERQFPKCEVHTFNGYPDVILKDEDFWSIPEFTQSFLIIDDCSDLVGSSFEFLCRGLAHHKNISIFYISQVRYLIIARQIV